MHTAHMHCEAGGPRLCGQQPRQPAGGRARGGAQPGDGAVRTGHSNMEMDIFTLYIRFARPGCVRAGSCGRGWRHGRLAWPGSWARGWIHLWLLQQVAGGHGGARRGEEEAGGGHVELGKAKQLGRPLPAREGEPQRPHHHRGHHAQKSSLVIGSFLLKSEI